MLTPDRNPENLPAATVPEQPEAKAPLGKKSPILWVLIAVVGLFCALEPVELRVGT